MGYAETMLQAHSDRLNNLSDRLGRLEAQVAGLEQQSWQGAMGGGGGSFTLTGAVRPATAPGGGIAASAAGVSGSGTVTFYAVDPATGAETTDGTDTAFNFFTAAVGASKRIIVGRAVNSSGVEFWVVLAEQC